MKHLSYIVIFCFTLLSCNSNTILKKPKNLLPKEQMVSILVDTYIAKIARNTRNINGDRNINYLTFIYQNHHTDSITFDNSLKYYSANISQHEEILKLVKENIEYQLEEIKEAEKALDSLNTPSELHDPGLKNIKELE